MWTWSKPLGSLSDGGCTKQRSNDGTAIQSACRETETFDARRVILLPDILIEKLLSEDCTFTNPRWFWVSVLGSRVVGCPMANIECILNNQLCGMCEYCVWKREGAPLSGIPAAFIECPEAARLTRVFGPGTLSTTSLRTNVLRPTGSFHRTAVHKAQIKGHGEVSEAESRLFKFLRLLRWMGTAPWSNVNFGINNLILNRLTASHLHLITGKNAFDRAPKAALFKAISPKLDLQGKNDDGLVSS